MADLNYTLSIEDRQALQSLKSVQASVKSTTDAFRGLGTAIAGIATGAFTANAFNMATALNNLSNSTGIALQSIVGFGQALQASGGTIDRAVDGVSDLVKNIGEAARGSKELQNAFARVGVSFSDLRNLSEQDILRKTIAGLAAIPDSATRTATAMKIMGESVKGVDLQNLNKELDGFTQRAAPNAAAIAAAATAQKNFASASNTLQIELLAALKPISELAANITKVTGVIAEFIRIGVDIAVVAASFFVITKAFALVRAAAVLVIGAFRDLFAAFSGLSRTFGSFLTQIRAVWREGAITDKTYAGLGKRIKYLSQEIPLLGSALAVLGTAGTLAYRSLSRLFGLDTDDTENQSEAETKRLQAMNDRAAAQQKVNREVIDGNLAELKTIREGITAYQQSTAEMQKRIGTQTSLLRATEEQRFAVETIAEAEQNYLKAIEPLTRRLVEIRGKGKSATEDELRLIPELQTAIGNMSSEYEKQYPALQALIRARIEEMQVAKDLELVNQSLTRQAENRAASESAVRDIILQGQERINEAYNQASLVGLPAIKAQLQQIAQEEEKIALAAKRRVAEQMGDDTTGLDEAIARITAASAVITERRQQAAQAIYDEQNSFVSGWSRALSEYAATATNAATQAQNIFSTVTKSIEDSFVNFAKTGKLSVKDLFKTIVETILRSQVQQLLARTFGGGFGGGGGSILGSLFAGFFANGGSIPSGKFGVVGEAGPELVSGPATVTPMGSVGGGTTTVTYNINAVDASSFRNLVAQDPEFIFAVTEQGRRRQPSQRR